MQDRISRRSVLGSVSVSAAFGLAGCGDNGSGGDEDDDGTTDVPPGGVGGEDDSLGDAVGDDGGIDGGSGGVQPPEGSVRFEYEPNLGRFTGIYESGPTLDSDNTGLLVVDVFQSGERQAPLRDIWYTGPSGTLEPGATVDGTYPFDAEEPQPTLAVQWGPPGCEDDCVGSLPSTGSNRHRSSE